MPIVLFRVDERLIHGQVVVGWGGPLHADRIVVVDDDLAASAWEQELYCLGVPPEIEASFSSVEEASRRIPGWKEDPRRIIVLVRDLATTLRLGQSDVLEDQEVNLGGIHHAPGRQRVLPYLHLSDADREVLRTLAARGVKLSARDLPGSRKVSGAELSGDD